MIQREEHVLLTKIRHDVEDARAKPVDFFVNLLRDAVRRDVQTKRTARPPTFDLLADEEIARFRITTQKIQTTVDAVVIRNRDQIHAAPLRGSIDRLGRGVAIARAKKLQMARVSRVVRMNVQIGAEVLHSGLKIINCSSNELALR